MALRGPIPPELRRSVLSKFLLGFEGTSVPEELAELLRAGLAGVVIYPRNFASPESLHSLTEAVRAAAGGPVLIGIDQEGGTRFSLREPFTIWPSPPEIGLLDDPALTGRVASAMAKELRAAGCNVNFAPMLDLAINPASPVTRNRSLGSDPEKVARLGAAFLRGMQAEGVLACAKHFPGHGDAAIDPHEDLPVFHGTLDQLRRREFIPFARAIQSNVPLVMTAHILLPNVDPDQPASLSRRILSDILRTELGFSGVILIDDIGMGAIAKRYGPGEAAVRAFLAGSDIVMICHDWTAVQPALAAVCDAYAGKQFSRAAWDASQDRIEGVRRRSAAARWPNSPAELIGCTGHRVLAEEIRARVASTGGT